METFRYYEGTKDQTGQAYISYFETPAGVVRVFTGGRSCSARCAGFVRDRLGLLPSQVREFSPATKTGKKLIAKSLKIKVL